MTTREEIREGIDKEVAWELCLYCGKHDQDPNLDNRCNREEPCEASMVTAKTIRGIYHSKGVCIKVESGWCPAHGYPLPCDKCGAPKGTWSVEPLIEEVPLNSPREISY